LPNGFAVLEPEAASERDARQPIALDQAIRSTLESGGPAIHIRQVSNAVEDAGICIATPAQ
jgi:hypothetical protein